MKTNRIIVMLMVLVSLPSFTLFAQNKELTERDRAMNYAFRSLRGVGIELNYKKAFIIFQKYAQQGDGEALNAIGMMYRRGLGVKQNDEKAFRYFVQSSENGYAKAAFNLSLMYKFGNYVNQKQDSAVYWVEKAEAMGFNNTDYNIAYSYYKGKGKKQSYKEAVKHFSKGAEKGDAGCMFSLGYCYYKGRGVERNAYLGKYWIEKAAEKGYTRAADFIVRNDSKSFGKNKVSLRSSSIEPINQYIPLRHAKISNQVTDADIVGEWTGKLINYDWSGEEIEKETPLKIVLQINDDRIDGLWVENETDPVRIDAQLKDTLWAFNNTQLYEDMRPLTMQNGSFKLETKGGVEYLTGDISYYCETTREEMPPSHIVLQRTATGIETVIDSDISYRIYPNPVTDKMLIDFSVDKTQNISISIFDMGGKKVLSEKPKSYENGDHTVELNTASLPSGAYIVKLIGETINKSSKITKQ